MTRRSMNDNEVIDDIRVPIGDSGEHVSIDPHNLPQKVEDVLGVLQSELAPLHAWLECAKAYLAEDNEEAFLEIVGSGCSPGTRKDKFFNPLAAFLLFSSLSHRVPFVFFFSRARSNRNPPAFSSSHRIEFCADVVNSLSLSSRSKKPSRTRARKQRLNSTTRTIFTGARSFCAARPRTK